MRCWNLLGSIVLLVCIGGCAASHADNCTETARRVGPRLVDNLLARQHPARRNYGLIYPEVCAGFGAIRLAGAMGDQPRLDRLIDRYDTIVDLQAQMVQGRPFIPFANHVDTSVFGILPMEIHRQTDDRRYLERGIRSAQIQWDDPLPDGLTRQTRWWVDDIYMILTLQTQAYRVSGEEIYLDRAALQVSAYLDKLQQPNGLFHHADNSPFYWGRGNGWVAAGLAELLSELPPTHEKYPRILKGYRLMMDALLKCQARSGMWRQLLDNPKSWEESSGTGMFIFAMALGVRNGWLERDRYLEPTRRAYLALAKRVDRNGAVHDCCVGTNKGYTAEYYLERKRPIGDLHGQSAALWATWAVLENQPTTATK